MVSRDLVDWVTMGSPLRRLITAPATRHNTIIVDAIRHDATYSCTSGLSHSVVNGRDGGSLCDVGGGAGTTATDGSSTAEDIIN